MSKPKILLQLDGDNHPSVFDSVVAIDAGAEHLLRHGSVSIEQVQSLVHGVMFTRGPKDLSNSAIFIGGSDVEAGERLLEAVTATFFGPLRVSVMLDANGANTTAAAAVLSASRHIDLGSANAVVLGGTGPVGQRAARLLARAGSRVKVASRSLQRAEQACQSILAKAPDAQLEPVVTDSPAATDTALQGATVLIAAGAVGVELVGEAALAASGLQVAIDLNAVPPAGIETVEVMDRAEARQGIFCYGAIGVGGDKMKIHKAAVASLFQRNDQVLDAEEIYALGADLI